jgi:hypothetical protein
MVVAIAANATHAPDADARHPRAIMRDVHCNLGASTTRRRGTRRAAGRCMPNPMLLRAARSTLLASVVLFIALVVPAMCVYPGGTSWDPTTRGNDFWLNYLCDLQHRVALNGEPNDLGAHLAQGAMLALGLGLLPLWWTLPRLFPSFRRTGAAVRVLGVVSVAGAVATGLMPSDRFGSWHAVAIAAGAFPGLAAAGVAAVALLFSDGVGHAVRLTGVVTVAVSAVDFTLYARQELTGGAGPMAVAVLERVSILLVLAWMCVVAWEAAPVARRA